MIEHKLNEPEQDSPPENLPEKELVYMTEAELQARVMLLEERVDKGKALIQSYREEHDGATNFKYMAHLQKLTKELEQVRQQLKLTANRQVSFHSSLHKKAIAAFIELVDMNLRKEYDTPRYKEQESIVRKYIRENEDIFYILYHYDPNEG